MTRWEMVARCEEWGKALLLIGEEWSIEASWSLRLGAVLVVVGCERKRNSFEFPPSQFEPSMPTEWLFDIRMRFAIADLQRAIQTKKTCKISLWDQDNVLLEEIAVEAGG